MNKIKKIYGNLVYLVTGPFNMDKGDTLSTYATLGLVGEPSGAVFNNNNYQCCKGNVITLEDGSLAFLPFISNDCLRHEVYEKYMKVHNLDSLPPTIQATALASKPYLTRGFMLTSDKTGGNTIKKKGPFYISSLKPVNDATYLGREIQKLYPNLIKMAPITKRMFEFCSKSGDRDNTSIHKREILPEAHYYGNYEMDIENLEFLSAEDKTNDPQIPFLDNQTYLNIYLDNLRRNFNLNANPELKYYILKSSCKGDGDCEKGILLNNDMKKQLVSFGLKLLFLSHRPFRNFGGRMLFNKMDMTICYDDGTEKFVEINSESDVDKLVEDMEFCEFHNEVDYSVYETKVKYLEMLAKEEEKKGKKGKNNKKSNNNEDNNE